MLNEKQILEIREHLENAQNPVFFFDNDVDGLMSFILLRRFIDRGKGVAIKSFPELDVSYVKKVDELKSDYVFILDKPAVSQEFVDEVEKRNLQIVWIDHHDVEQTIKGKNLNYYNPFFTKKSNEPTSYLAYQVVNNKADRWLVMAGCISDNFFPDFVDEFAKENSEIWKKNAKSAFEILYESDFGKLIITLDFALKDRTSSVISLINYLFEVKYPSDLLVENSRNIYLIRRYSQINEVYQRLLDKAKKIARNSKKIIFFQYGGAMSLSADLANELYYRFPGKITIVAFIKGDVVNISIRGKEDVRKITLKAVDKIENATGGGHKNATGAKVSVGDLEKFVNFFRKEFE